MTIAVLSPGIARIPRLRALIGLPVCHLRWSSLPSTRPLTAVAGWGLRSSARRARAFAQQRGLPYIALEDGFLRSLGLGVNGEPPVSLLIDELGIYYDATRPSQLEQLIASTSLSGSERQNAQSGLERMRRDRLSKYNHAPTIALPPRSGCPRVLVLDQTKGDVSVRLGGADTCTFQAMLEAAYREHPAAEIWVKTHPDVIAGKKRGYLPLPPPDVKLIAEDACPQSLLSQVDVVYTATSHMGFEALIAGCQVVCFGMPWYAGWGLTDDRHPEMPTLKLRRYCHRSLEQLFHAAYLRYARYIHPETGEPGTFFDVAEWIHLNRNLRQQTGGVLWCVGMSWWKRAVVWPFLKHPGNQVRFISKPGKLPPRLPPDSKLVAWGMAPDAASLAARHGLPLLRMEDGFVRSLGLGSDLQPPLSVVVDDAGLYYAPAPASRLERLLCELELDPQQMLRAQRLSLRLLELRLSKYNVGAAFELAAAATGKTIVLVPGQVEDDASLREASPWLNSNLSLLREVRRLRPHAWLIYKPHPDVTSGNRHGAVSEQELACLADQVADNADIIACLSVADEVHTMTSQAGFEALLRGKPVHCYGMPFYAGWGLTHDHLPVFHRQRRLTLEQLVYGVLIAYPRYMIPGQPGFARAEAVVEHLWRRKQQLKPGRTRSHWLARQWRKGLGLLRTLR
ncbi:MULTISPECIES: capsular polysaccharide biosynthesis protein [Chromobacterium]|uniref:Capsular polysaccharide biosynthesis protein n=1 Tax=Chromobacterium rhizoryzae TaxID=1778675 RepID=A0AAD0RU52_9NEIS|nr:MULTISPECIES: capsular polysaccharide biosynthesis protein [Chromobacterium]AXT48547.1 capsular polysaccharide biosynthesis protein [Chromobacterium rhizoryzae]BBH15171.1 capsule polysaccharide modification protein LipA [Chromobacterium haemolyticum]